MINRPIGKSHHIVAYLDSLQAKVNGLRELQFTKSALPADIVPEVFANQISFEVSEVFYEMSILCRRD